MTRSQEARARRKFSQWPRDKIEIVNDSDDDWGPWKGSAEEEAAAAAAPRAAPKTPPWKLDRVTLKPRYDARAFLANAVSKMHELRQPKQQRYAATAYRGMFGPAVKAAQQAKERPARPPGMPPMMPAGPPPRRRANLEALRSNVKSCAQGLSAARAPPTKAPRASTTTIFAPPPPKYAGASPALSCNLCKNC